MSSGCCKDWDSLCSARITTLGASDIFSPLRPHFWSPCEVNNIRIGFSSG